MKGGEGNWNFACCMCESCSLSSAKSARCVRVHIGTFMNQKSRNRYKYLVSRARPCARRTLYSIVIATFMLQPAPDAWACLPLNWQIVV